MTTTDYPQLPASWSADGQSLVIQEAPLQSVNLAMVSLGGDNASQGLVETEFFDVGGEVSPDGRWMAYSSDQSGRNEVYVQERTAWLPHAVEVVPAFDGKERTRKAFRYDSDDLSWRQLSRHRCGP